MATIKNKVNELLYSAPERITGATVKLSSGPNTVLIVPKGGTMPIPEVLTVTASMAGYTQPQYKWFVRFDDNSEFIEQIGYTTNPFIYGNSWYTEYNTSTVVQVKVEVSEASGVGTYGVNTSSDILAIPVIREGNDGVSINSITLTLYKRTTNNTAPVLTTTGNATYSFTTSTVVGQPSGWTQTVPSNSIGQYLWSTSIRIASTSNSYSFANINWSSPVQVASDGITGTNTAIIYAYKRSADLVVDNPGDIVYNFTSNSITNTVLANDWSKTIPSGMDALYVTTVTAASKESTVTIAPSQWSTPVVLATSGITVATVYLYIRTNSSSNPPTLNTTGSCTYTFSNGVLSGSIPSGWTQLLPAVASGSVLWAVQATASGSSSVDTILNNEWSAPRVLSTGGSRGNRQLYSNNVGHTSNFVYLNNAAGADSYAAKAAALILSSTTAEDVIPTTPVTGDIVTFTNGTNYIYTIAYNASTSAWEPPGTVIDGTLLVTGSVTAAKIDSTGLSIKDANGNIILSAGVPLKSANLDPSITSSITTAQTLATSAAATASTAQTTATAAATAASNKLSKSGTDTLSATISVNAVTGAGFRAGDLTWNSSGVRTGGKGVAMTPGGITSHNGVRTTFNLDASTGDATFGGVAQSADGLFVIDFVNKTIKITTI